MLVLRSEEPIEQENIDKISLFTDINPEAIFQSVWRTQLFMRLF